VRIAHIAAGSAALLSLLTWLAVRSMTTDPYRTEFSLRAVETFAAAESALHRDVLAARTGMLRSYDPLVAELAAMRAAIDHLSGLLSEDQGRAQPLAALAEVLDRKEAWTEQFKSQNSLLQNSLAHFNLFSAKLSGPGHDPALVQQVSGLATAMLHLTLDTSPPAAASVDARMKAIDLAELSKKDVGVAEALLAHARLLLDVLPKTDMTVKSIVMLNSTPQQEVLAAHIRAISAASEKDAEVFRFFLYGTSILLAGLLVLLGVQLQAHARSLRQRANLEHVIADFSTRVINSQHSDVDRHVETALSELARCLGAERAYFITPGEPTRTLHWCRAGANFPAGWPLRAIALARLLDPNPEGILHASLTKAKPRSPSEATLAAAGVHSWLGTVSLQPGGPLLGFDILREGHSLPRHNCGLFRMAYDAITNALERDHLEREKERLEAGLQRARRMETIGSLASGIAHNFNNIIGAILGHTEMAFAHAGMETGLADNLTEIRRAGERARDIVDQILTFGRRGVVKREKVCMRAIVAEAEALLAVSLPPGVKLRVQPSSVETPVIGEPAQLQQVILNVCNNAAQAMEDGGDIEISMETRSVIARLRVGPEELGPGSYVVVSIADSGRGMTEATRERIFDPFFTTRQQGNGLGLATVREIVSQHKGAIGVWSAPGAGTRFDIWLPAVPCEGAVAAGPPDRGSGETVLVVEAARDNLLWQEEMLAALGYEPVGFAEPASAVAACRDAPRRFDAAVLCNSLGATPVLELAHTLSQAAPLLPILLATASAKEFSAPHLARAGVRELIHLPLESAELASALRACLAGPPLSPGSSGPSRRASL
jgi:signal transduction histidine kinase/CheY-like chemotaxis protein